MGTSYARGVRSGLVGRSGELAVLAEAARSVAGGAGTCVHIVGEAGIGKTSLLAVAVDELARQRVETRTAAAHETDHHRPMALVQALLPWKSGRPATDPLASTIDAVERLAAAGPVALVADDVHWADDASLDALGAVARRAEMLGVLIVTAARPQPASPMLRCYEATLAPRGVRLAPKPLAAADLAALVAHRTGAPPGPALTAVLAGTAGNPFLAVELVVSLLDENRLAERDGVVELADATDPTGAIGTPDTSAMPDDLMERLARRALHAVPGPGGDLVLRATAAIPGGLTVDELAALLDQPLGDLVTATLVAVAAGVLIDTGSMLVFRHDLLRRAVLRSTPPSIVRVLQRQVATLLIERQAAAERIAACLLADDRPPDPAETDQLVALGRSMKQRHPGVAADLLRRALDGIRPDDPSSLPATIELGWVLAAAGRAREVDSLIHDRVGHSAGPLPVELLRLESVALSLTGRLGEASVRYDDIDPTRLVEEFGTDDASGAELADAAAELAFLRVTSGRLDEAARLIDWVDASPTPGSTFRRATVSTVRAWLLGTVGAFEEGAELARAALSAIAEDDRLAVTAGSPTLALGLALDNLGDGEGALVVFRRSEAGPGPPRWTPPLLQFGAALALYRRGEWDDALAEAEAGLLAAEETGLALGAFWPCSIGTLISCARGQLDDARGWLDRLRPITPRHEVGMEWLLYASAALQEAQGHTDQAATVLDTVVQAIMDAEAPALLLNGATDMVRLAQATGRTDSVARVAGQIEAMTRRTASPVVAAMARWMRGLTGDGVSGAGGWGEIEAAADQLAAHGRVPEAARARHDAAVIAARSGETSDARRLAGQAFLVYDQLGAQQLHGRLRSELRAAGLVMRPRRSPPRPSHGWDSLTASESTVVDLAGRGLTNTQIAERLYISRRTVESHLGRVYAKLRLSTRAQLVAATARYAGEHGTQRSPDPTAGAQA